MDCAADVEGVAARSWTLANFSSRISQRASLVLSSAFGCRFLRGMGGGAGMHGTSAYFHQVSPKLCLGCEMDTRWLRRRTDLDAVAAGLVMVTFHFAFLA